jgi:predicted O-methyltransferase YrrM
MDHDLWTAVDGYIGELLVAEDDALRSALDRSREAGLPPINVAPAQGKFLHLLSRISGARRILEIGTLGAYSTIWLARALPATGRLVTLEVSEHHASVAARNLEIAGVRGSVDLRVGKALDILPVLQAEGAGPFDLSFIDADKQSNAEYFDWAVKLSRPGSVIVVDNVVRQGHVIDADSADPAVQGVRRLNDGMAQDSRVEVTEIQTVGLKGYDGFALALVTDAGA